jgi:hypothetical protein
LLLLAELLSDVFELSIAVWLTATEDVTLEISMAEFLLLPRMLQLHSRTGHESNR